MHQSYDVAMGAKVKLDLSTSQREWSHSRQLANFVALSARFPAYMASALTTKPPRQLSRLGTNPGIYRQGNATKPDKQVNVHVHVREPGDEPN